MDTFNMGLALAGAALTAGSIAWIVKTAKGHAAEIERAFAEADGQDWIAITGEPVPIIPAANDDAPARPELTDAETAVLYSMSGEIGYTADTLSRWTGLPKKTVTAARRRLHELELAHYGALSDDGMGGQLQGRGYWLTAAGLDEKARIHESWVEAA